ncbi:YSIRK-type signal peptide-containing protein [Streptococcus macacae]|uniref:Gram-positive signal peptide protein, YSIRK family n=1 Tax=Streptococcus macacae NCTC 11558 TaxID=764298 RepID=G5JYN3_9STRE|nr:YSIRK-type signal peptide-containing protein [Streptococcus macacae]EHJ52697.1 Gram-positive signal peptide protein, YSIRK family [Streptococcus macacae NCTC 11558]SUN78146.1 glucan-binding protein D [Streptococcus macacae NCTC 11558]
MKFEKKEHYRLRKLKFGLTSVTIAASLFGITTIAKANDKAAAEQASTTVTQVQEASKQTWSTQAKTNETVSQNAQTTTLANELSTAANTPSTSTVNDAAKTKQQYAVTEASSNSQQTTTATTAASTSDQKRPQTKGKSQSQPSTARQTVSENDSSHLTNTFVDDGQGNWYYLGSDGKNVTGSQIIDGKTMYFGQDGKQVKGGFAKDTDGNNHYYDQNDGSMWTDRFVNVQGNWYYLNHNGTPVTGKVSLNGQNLYFNPDGSQVKGQFIQENGVSYYYDENSGDLLKNTKRIINGAVYQFDDNGRVTTNDKVEVVKSSIVVDSYEFGPAVSKIVLQLNHKVTTDVIHTAATVTTAGVQRKILNSYVSDAAGHVVYFDNSPYVTLELDVPYDPNDSSKNASPFIFDAQSFRNKWVDHYTVKLENLQVKTGNSNSSQTISSEQDTINNRLLLTTNRFSERGSYGNYHYAAYRPANTNSSQKRPLLIWLHGVGEVGTDVNIPLLASNVVRLTEDPIQSHFTSTGKGDQKGAYVLALQSPTPWNKDQTADLMKAINAYVESHPDIDSHRIYLAGVSNGGGMTLDMGVAYPHYFAALVPIAASYNNQLTDNNSQITANAWKSLKNQPMWLIHTRADQAISADTSVLPFYKKMLENGAQNKWLSYYETNVGNHYSGVIYNGHWSWIYFLNDQVKGVQNSDNAKSWPGLTGMVATNSTYGGDAKANVNGEIYNNIFDWLNRQQRG